MYRSANVALSGRFLRSELDHRLIQVHEVDLPEELIDRHAVFLLIVVSIPDFKGSPRPDFAILVNGDDMPLCLARFRGHSVGGAGNKLTDGRHPTSMAAIPPSTFTGPA